MNQIKPIESNGANIIARNGWLNGKTIETRLHAGETLLEFANRFLPQHLIEFVRVKKNGEDEIQWQNLIPSNNDHILLYVLPAGGDDGKSALGLIASIGLSVFTAGIGNVYARAIVMVAGGLVINAIQSGLIKPPVQPSNQSRTSPFFKFTSQNNELVPLGSVQRLYGKMRVFPKLPAPPFTTNFTNIYGQDQQYLTMLFDFGYGPLKIDEETIKIGETPLREVFTKPEDREYRIHENYTSSNQLVLFDESRDVQQVGAKVDQAGVIRRTAKNTKRAVIDLSFPQGFYYINETYGTYGSAIVKVKLEVREIVNGVAGIWVPLVTKALYRSSANFEIGKILNHNDWDHWVEADGYEYLGLEVGRTEIEFINDDISTSSWYSYHFSIGQRLKIHDLLPLVTVTNRTVNGSKADYVMTFDHPLPARIKASRRKGSGPWEWPFDDTTGQPTNFGILPSDAPLFVNRLLFWTVYQTAQESVFQGRKTEPFETSLNVDFDVAAEYDIRITRLSPNPKKYYFNEFNWIYLNSLYSTPIVFEPETAHTVLELKVKATDEISGVIDTLSCVAESQVEVWDGSNWTLQVSNNPAWIYCDVLMGSATKFPVSLADRDRLMDLPAIKAWADYCDQSAPNDDGVAQFQCNLIIDGETTVKQVLQTVCSTGRAAPSRTDGKYSIVRDTLDTPPVQLITPKNCRNFTTTVSYVRPPHGLKISIQDEAYNYEPTEVVVYNDGYDFSNATVFENLNLAGTTRYQQAYRLGRYYLATAKLQRERIECGLDIENLVATRGDVVLVANDTIRIGGVPCRIADIQGDVITLDEQIQSAGLGDPYWQNVVLLLHCDGVNQSTNFIDSSSYGKSVIAQNARIDSAQSKFGQSCNLRPSPAIRYLQIEKNSHFNFGQDIDFTIEFWMNCSDRSANNQPLFSNYNNASFVSGSRQIILYGAYATTPYKRNRIAFSGYDLADDYALLLSETIIEANQWYHVALTRSGDILRLFVNGRKESVYTGMVDIDFSKSPFANAGTLIGRNGWDNSSFNGYVDEVRVTRGIARYTANFPNQNFQFADFGADPDVEYQAADTIRMRRSQQIIPVTQISSNQLELPSGEADSLIIGDILEYGVTEQVKAPFIVEEITAGSDFSATLRLVEQRLEVDDAIYGPIPERVPRIGIENNYSIGAPLNVHVIENVVIENGQKISKLTLSWLPPDNGFPNYYRVYRNDGDFGVTNLGTTTETKLQLDDVNISRLDQALILNYSVVAVVERVGISQAGYTLYTINQDTTPPPDIEMLNSNAQSESIYLFWILPDDLSEVHHYEIRHSSMESGTWQTSSRLIDYIAPDSNSITVPLRTGLYFIKAVDASNNYSTNAAVTKAQIEDISGVDLFDVIQFDPFANGVHDNTVQDMGYLELVAGQEVGWYYPDPVLKGIHFSMPSKVRLSADIQTAVLASDEDLGDPWFIPLQVAVPLQPSLTGKGLNFVDAQIYYRYTDGSFPIESNSWTKLIVADVTATDIEFAIRLDTKEINYRPSVFQALVLADWVERTESGNDVAIDAQATTINFATAFTKPPTVSISLQNANAGDYFNRSAVTKYGFDVTVFNADGQPISGEIDWTAYGYGKEF